MQDQIQSKISLSSNGGETASQIRRLIAFCAFATATALLISNIGWVLLIDRAISDKLFFSAGKKTSGQVIILSLDDKTIQHSTTYPYDREMLARAIDKTMQAGARKFFIDSLIDKVKTKEGDLALNKALARAGKARVGTIVFRSGGTTRNPKLIKAHPQFSKHSTPVTLDLTTHSDRRVRSLQSINAPGSITIQEWLTGQPVREHRQFIDFSFDPKTIPRYSLYDVANGLVPATVMAGKLIIFGRVNDDPQRRVDVPKYYKLARPEIAALAVETAIQGTTVRNQDFIDQFLTIFILCILFGWIAAATRKIHAKTLFLLTACTWPFAAYLVFRQSGLMLPVISTIAALVIIWQKTTASSSGLTALLRKLKTRFIGIDRTSLVTALEAMPEPAFLYDRKGDLLGFNQAFGVLSFEDRAKLLPGSSLHKLFGDAATPLLQIAQADETKVFALQAFGENGAQLVFETSPRAINTATGTICIAGMKDITIATAREKELLQLAFRDTLTGLHNRRAFMDRLREHCADLATKNAAVLFIDLDGFKQVNDTLGHEAGDLLLKGVSKRIQSLMGENDLAARLGGDEFALICHFEEGSKENIPDLASAIIATLGSPFTISAKSARIGASIGISYFPHHSRDPEQLLKFADMAMYTAKQNKPAWQIYEQAETQLSS